jgi:hypothetical protein
MIVAIVGVAVTKSFQPQPTPTPAATPTPIPTSTSIPTATPVPTLNPVAIERQDVIVISGHAYNAVTKIPAFAFTSDGHGGTLYGWTATCRKSADGYCQKVFFFDGTRFLGTDTSTPSSAINSVEAAGSSVIDVTYANYKSTDPLCCPSGVPVTISYTWNGTSISASATPPGH